MPKYDYEVKAGPIAELGVHTSTYKGTVEASDPRSACFVARADITGKPYKPFAGSWEDAEEFLQSVGVELNDEDDVFDYSGFDPSEHSVNGTECCMFCGDYQFNVLVQDHKPERALKAQEVEVVVTLKLTPKSAMAWSAIEEAAKAMVRDRVAGLVGTEDIEVTVSLVDGRQV